MIILRRISDFRSTTAEDVRRVSVAGDRVALFWHNKLVAMISPPTAEDVAAVDAEIAGREDALDLAAADASLADPAPNVPFDPVAIWHVENIPTPE